MKKTLLSLISLLVTLAAGSVAQAAGIGLRVGTTGLGADVAFNVAPTFDARFGYSGGSLAYDASTSGARYDGDVKLSNLNALVDWRPLVGSSLFRVTGGIIFNSNRYEATGTPSSGPGSFQAKVESGRASAPYLGIGYGSVAGAGIGFYADLGLMFMGEPKALLTANCGGLSAAQCNTLNSQLTAEAARLQNDLNRMKYFPVLNLGVTIGF